MPDSYAGQLRRTATPDSYSRATVSADDRVGGLAGDRSGEVLRKIFNVKGQRVATLISERRHPAFSSRLNTGVLVQVVGLNTLLAELVFLDLAAGRGRIR